jgi:hypothetical protein
VIYTQARVKDTKKSQYNKEIIHKEDEFDFNPKTLSPIRKAASLDIHVGKLMNVERHQLKYFCWAHTDKVRTLP